jgi:threonyl-tRNA synthetase
MAQTTETNPPAATKLTSAVYNWEKMKPTVVTNGVRRALFDGPTATVDKLHCHITTLNDEEALINYAKPIVAELRANMVRVDSDFSATLFKAKIANAEQLRVHTMLVIGGRDMEAGAVSVRLHHGGPQGAKPKAEVVADILASIKERRG